MGRPSSFYAWAYNTRYYNITVDGTPYNGVINKYPPTVGDTNYDFTTRGFPFFLGSPVQYFNYQLYGLRKWNYFFTMQYWIGDIFKTTRNLTPSEVTEQLSGFWELLGTVDKGFITQYIWRKTN